MKKVLYDTYSDNCCAYCTFHHCSMTVRQMRKKDCLKRQCSHLRKYEEHDFWVQRARLKEKKMAKKLAAAAR